MSQTLGAGAHVSLTPPHGLEQIIATFGDIFDYIKPDHTLDPRWAAESLKRVALPFPIPLSWDLSRSVNTITCHALLAEAFCEAFEGVLREGLQPKIISFGGCFAFRPQRTGSKLSTHAWGIAIDLNSKSNAQGTLGDMDPSVVKLFERFGFEWGGKWQGSARDPMHFQFCSGY
jgi:D-alanyl-D-alanine carboxypeptidase